MSQIRYAKLIGAVFLTLLITLFANSLTMLPTPVQALASSTDLTKYVDPLTGTGAQPNAPSGWAEGDTFPGADAPFGMVQWSPDSVQPHSGGYWYDDNRIKGFSLTHMNGAGCPAFGDIPFMPYPGTVTTSPATHPEQYYATFSHANEQAYAGYYRISFNNGMMTELTATQRSGAARFTYPQGQTATLLVNVSGSANKVSDAQANIGRDTISGWASSGGFCGAKDVYRVYFWAQFSQPFATVGTWHNDSVTPSNRAVTMSGMTISPAVARTMATPQYPDMGVSGPGSGAYVTFDTSHNTAISVRVGLSFVSIANAHSNVEHENPSGNFATVLQQAGQTWNRWLGSIRVSGGTPVQLTTFYTALYHVLLQPNVFSDENGEYIGFDGKTHSVPSGHAQYANYSGWDIYRSEAQLLALLAPQEASDIAQSMVNDYTQGGQLPKWTPANSETDVMVGDPADPIISDIYAFGGKNFDTKAALAAMIKEATQTNNARPGLNYLDTLGYEPLDGTYGCCNFYGPAATTLEYNTADFSIATMAQALGDTASYQKFMTRAQDWQKLYNPADGYLEPRMLDGSFPGSYNPARQTGWVEGNGAQYNWMVPFNVHGLFSALGGNSKVVQRLDTFLSQLNAGPDAPYAFLGNEPTIEVPWEYDYAGAPYKTQQMVRKVVNTLWYPGPEGMAGNDDLGTMSAWYVWAALGMFPETPGTANLVLASPLFPIITLHRESGQTIQISAPGASATTYYVQSLKVNGKNSTKPWLAPDFITHNGTLEYILGNTANTAWGASPNDAPPSYQFGQQGNFVSGKPSRIVVAPANTGSFSILGQNIDGKATTITWSATAPAGLSIAPTSGHFKVSPDGTGEQAIKISVPASTEDGTYMIKIAEKSNTEQKSSSSSMRVVVARPGSLLPFFNNIGISDDSNGNGADFDGGGVSYSAQALAQAGFKPGATVRVNGASYTFPNVASGTFDNIEVDGQTIQTPKAAKGASKLTFLGSASNGNTQGTVTIKYTDGGTQTAQFGFSDWTLGAGKTPLAFNNQVAAKLSYRNVGDLRNIVTTYLFTSAPIMLTAGKMVASITLSAATQQGDLHVFALAIA